MGTKVAERVVLDTNVLLAATDEGRATHAASLYALERWPASGTTVYTSGQILREYLVVATRPVEQNGLGLSRVDALANVRVMRQRLSLLEENRRVADRLAGLVADIDCSGKQIHDANVVATALAHGISAIATANTADFDRFIELVTIVDIHTVRPQGTRR
jgi:predicted nucleic acid-binding protein